VIEQPKNNRRALLEGIKKIARVVGVCMAAPVFLWLIVGFIPVVPSVIDVFGMGGLRIPSGVVIGGLMLAAFGFEDF
jgi:hypothetical protein